MNFADADPCGPQLRNRVLWLFIFDGKMAGVVVDANIPKQALTNILLKPVRELLEKVHRLNSVFEHSQRFRFKSKMKVTTSSVPEAVNGLAALQQMLEN